MAEEKEKVTEAKTEETAETKAEETKETAEAKTEETAVFADNKTENEEVVFAPIDTPSRKPVGQADNKHRFPVIPVVTAAAVVCIGVSVALIFMSNTNNNVPAVSTESTVSITADASVAGAEEIISAASVSSKQEEQKERSAVSEQPVVSEQTIEISQMDTSSIVFGDNVTVEGISLKGKTLAQAYDAMQDTVRALREKVNISVNCEGKNVTLTQDDFAEAAPAEEVRTEETAVEVAPEESIETEETAGSEETMEEEPAEAAEEITEKPLRLTE